MSAEQRKRGEQGCSYRRINGLWLATRAAQRLASAADRRVVKYESMDREVGLEQQKAENRSDRAVGCTPLLGRSSTGQPRMGKHHQRCQPHSRAFTGIALAMPSAKRAVSDGQSERHQHAPRALPKPQRDRKTFTGSVAGNVECSTSTGTPRHSTARGMRHQCSPNHSHGQWAANRQGHGRKLPNGRH